jgi:hypothetical protein
LHFDHQWFDWHGDRPRSVVENIKQSDRVDSKGNCVINAWTSLALALGTCGLIGTFPNNAHAGRAVASAQLASHACQATMGLNPSEAEYAACVRSLNLSLAAASEENDISRNLHERACAEMGIRLRSATFNKCVVDLSSTLLKLESIPGR